MMPETLLPKQIVNLIFDLYRKHGNQDYIGEPVSQLEHMAQAAELAKKDGQDDEVILATFFHDIGHLCASENNPDMNGYGAMNHEEIGSIFLKRCGFSDRVVSLVKGHVEAKRYLTFRFPTYLERLSEASRITLEFQGGVMTKTEAEDFESNPNANLMLKMRTWDDLAKITDIPVTNLAELENIALKHLIHQKD